MKKHLLIASLFLFICAFPAQVSAHATPIVYAPGASSVLEEAPQRVTITFSERVEPAASSISVLGPNGESAHTGEATVSPGDQHVYFVELQDSGEGTYVVSWNVVSADDGHFTSGGFLFSVGQESEVSASIASFEIDHSSAAPEAISVWFELVGHALLLGILALLVVFRMNSKYGETAIISKKYLYRAVWAALLFVLLGAGLYLFIKSQELQMLQDLEFLQAAKTFISTASGSFAFYRLLLAVFFVTIFFAFKDKILKAKKLTKPELLLWAAILAVGYLRAQISHASASELWPEFSVFINFIHVVAKSLWVGGLVVFVFGVLPSLIKNRHKHIDKIYAGLNKIFNVSFGVFAATGVYIIWLHLKSLDNLFTTSWGVGFVTLALVAAVLLILRVYNQLTLARIKKYTKTAIAAVATEAVLGLLLLFVTGFMIITTPPVVHGNTFEKSADSQDYVISFNEHPFNTDQMLVSFEEGRNPAQPENVVITATNQERGIGPIVVDTEQVSRGGFVFPKTTLSPNGMWQILITGQMQTGYDAVASFGLNFPSDIEASSITRRKLSVGYFEVLLIVSIIGAVAMAFLLYRINNKVLNRKDSENVFNKQKHAYAYAFLASLIIFIFVWFAWANIFRSEFQKNCDANGHLWNSSVPQRFGKVTHSVSVYGCSLGVAEGAFHFGSEEEYNWFIQTADADISMDISEDRVLANTPVTLTFNILDSAGEPIDELVVYHERLLHTIIVGEDFETFFHVHAEDQGLSEEDIEQSRFPLEFTFPKAGVYIVSADTVVRDTEVTRQFLVEVEEGSEMEAPQPDFARERQFGDYTAELIGPDNVPPGEWVKFRYVIKKNGKELTDLQPYLGAPMHIAIVRHDMRSFVHAHGQLPTPFLDSIFTREDPDSHQHLIVPDAFGPYTEAYMFFQGSGIYHVFGEFKHGGEVIVSRFTIEVN